MRVQCCKVAGLQGRGRGGHEKDGDKNDCMVAGYTVAYGAVADYTVAHGAVAGCSVAGCKVAGCKVAGCKVAGCKVASGLLHDSRCGPSRGSDYTIAGCKGARTRWVSAEKVPKGLIEGPEEQMHLHHD